MDSIVEKLSDIESTAEAIVEHAEAAKFESEKQIQAKRDKFDEDLEADTQKELERIRAKAAERIDKILDEQRKKNQSTIDSLKHEFEENHTAYAQMILTNITEV